VEEIGRVWEEDGEGVEGEGGQDAPCLCDDDVVEWRVGPPEAGEAYSDYHCKCVAGET
jgi:hypothetical protein